MRVLVANRGEIAVRIIRAVHELGGVAVAVYADDDAASLHVARADAAIALPGSGPAAYLDVQSIVSAAADCGAQAVHPGYGFLSENAGFARALHEAQITFIGPSPEVLDALGDKVAARTLALRVGVPVPPGLDGPVTIAQARRFFDDHGPLMLKAVAGGGGRGMREIHRAEDLDDEFDRCASEARGAFGEDALYVEKLITNARHIEVQVVGDAEGRVTHLWERDCSIQRRHQKLIEIAPAPELAESLRTEILHAAVELAMAAGYVGVGTVEFLVTDDTFWFLEANPRVQVEHTVTEAITGVDLVATQIRLAEGATLEACGIRTPPEPRGFAIQARVNAEQLDADGVPRPGAGTLTAFEVPSGPGVRVDTAGCSGAIVSPRYDPLLAKVICDGPDFHTAGRRAAAAIEEFVVDGVSTNQALLHAILTNPEFLAGACNTSYVAAHLAELGGHVLPHRSLRRPQGRDHRSGAVEFTVPEGLEVVQAPMSGVVQSIAVDVNSDVPEGAVLVVLESMKMEHVVRADRGLRVARVLATPGDLVESGTPLLAIEHRVHAGTATAESIVGQVDEDWSAEVEEIRWREQLAAGLGGTDKIARQHHQGKLTARERIDRLIDPGSAIEVGGLAGFAGREDGGRTVTVAPTNFIGGTARIDGRKVVIGVDDFTRRGGSGDAAIHQKQVFLERYAHEMRLPMVRLLDGQSGGGSVKMALDAGYTYIPVNPGWDAVVGSMSVVPVVAAGLGPTVGLGAARLVMSHLAVLVEGVGQLFTAGPPVVSNATGENLTKEELGGAEVHRANGSVERVVASEDCAFSVIRQFLSYLPTNVDELPPVRPTDDPVDRREESLLSAIPRNPRRPYAIGPILDAIFDAGSVFRYAEYGGGTVTALACLDGHPVGVIAADPFQGATMSVEGALAITRLVDLCETFHLPIVSLTDQAGMTIGLAAERRATIRHGARAIAAVYQARVPQAEIVLRRVYGVGGAGIVNRHRALRTWAWPSGDWGSLPVQGGIEAAFRGQLADAADPATEAQRLQSELEALGSPFRTAEKFGVTDLIDPRASRALLCDWVLDAYRIIPAQLGRPAFGTRP